MSAVTVSSQPHAGRSGALPAVAAATATVPLGGGRAVMGAQGVALDPTTGLVYIGLNGTIVGGCAGDSTSPQRAGARQMSIVDPARGLETAAVAAGNGPVWPTVDPDRGTVYMANSGDGTVTVHNAASGATTGVINVGGRPHMAGLDYSTRLMLVGNTVRSSDVIAEQNRASVVNTSNNSIVREFESGPAPHGVVVDQERNIAYMTAVGNGEIAAVNLSNGATIMTGRPIGAYGSAFGNNNMIARQAATRRLFQVNSQPGAIGVVVINETTLAAERVISFGSNARPWGLWVDESHRLLFAALPNSNVIGVADLDTLTAVATIAVGECPYAVAIDPVRRVGVASNQGTPSVNASATIFDLCPVYAAAGRTLAGCGTGGAPTVGAPSNLRATVTRNSVAFSWTAAEGAVTGYLLEAGTAPGTTIAALPTGSAATTYTVAAPDGTFYVRVKALAGAQAGAASNEVQVVVGSGPGCSTAPAAPAGLQATVAGRQVTLRWTAPAGSVTSYQVEAGSAAGLSNRAVVTTTATGLAASAPAGTYFVRVRAINACGAGAASSEITLTVV